jgi:hypothetical protein
MKNTTIIILHWKNYLTWSEIEKIFFQSNRIIKFGIVCIMSIKPENVKQITTDLKALKIPYKQSM